MIINSLLNITELLFDGNAARAFHGESNWARYGGGAIASHGGTLHSWRLHFLVEQI
jgi:hypothetical protein